MFIFDPENFTIMASLAEENYLKALYSISNQKEGVNASDLSSLLKVSLPTVNSMMKNLNRQGLVDYEKYKPLKLTENGKKEAALVLRKHRLTEMFLVDKMGFGWEEVHEIAEQLEHIVSPVLFERMDELLDFPTIDPHGSPIPDRNGEIELRSYKKLSDCLKGEIVRLEAISHDSSDFLKFLNTKDLKLGVIIEIKSIESFDKSMNVSYSNHLTYTFSQIVCENLLVKDYKP